MTARSRLQLIALAAMVGVALTSALGFWQLDRAAQKEALHAAMEAQTSKNPLDNAAVLGAPDPAQLMYQHAQLRGVWDSAHTVYLDNRQMNNRFGFYVFTPLLINGGKNAVLVQRGWLQRNFESRTALQPLQTPGGEVLVQGLIALPPGKLFELGKAAPAQIRQNLDLDQFRAETGLPLLAVILRQTGAPSEGLQRNWPPVNLGQDTNYGYAVQWFAMALAIAALFGWNRLLRPYLNRHKELPTP